MSVPQSLFGAALACSLLAGCSGNTDPGTSPTPTPSATPDPSGYKLVFADEFDSFDEVLWDRASHTFDNNAARFLPGNITYGDGKMALTLKGEYTDEGDPRLYTGGELRTDNTKGFYTFGRYVVRMKAARGSGVVSSFFTYRYNPWQEIDIEFLGKNTTEIHLNIFYNGGPAGSGNNNGDLNHQQPVVLPLGFDAAADFHEYMIEWEQGTLKWYADGKLLHSAPNPSTVPFLPQQTMMNLWAVRGGSVGWAGPIDNSALPTRAEYDYVRFYQKQP